MTVKQILSIVEIRTKIVSLGTYAAATAFLYSQNTAIHIGAAILMLASVLFVDMGTTAFNTYFDYLNGVDNQKFNLEKDKVLIHEGVDPGNALLTALLMFLLAVITGLILAFWRGLILIPLGALSMAVGFFYTAGPRPISSGPFGEIAAGGFLGSVLFLLVCFVQTGEFTSSAFIASLPLFFMIAQILTVNNTCDIIGDREAGRKTLSIKAGRKASLFIILFESLSAAVSVIIAAEAGIISSLQLYGIIPFLLIMTLILNKLFRNGLDAESKGYSMGKVSSLFLSFIMIYSSLFIAGRYF